MRVSHLSLADFRNYQSAELSLDGGFNLIVGRNGQGKTNLVEAIAYFGSLASHRSSSNSAMIRFGEDAAILRMRVAVRDREVLLEAQLNREGQNRAQVNHNLVRIRELPRWFSSVMFAPEDLSIVRGEPSLRRNFLNASIVSRNPAFIGVLADYDRVVRQRTSLLRSARASGNRDVLKATLPIWNEQLAELGVAVMFARREFVEVLRQPLQMSYESLVEADHAPQITLIESVTGVLGSRSVSRETFGDSEAGAVPRETFRNQTVEYVSRETLLEQFHEALQIVSNQEFERGVTLIGPHRDDLLLELNRLPVKGFASHGESWSFALSLKLALAKLLANESPAGDPVLILDDVFAELDSRRRARLFHAVEEFEQVIVTAAVEEDVPVGATGRMIRVSQGSITHNGTEQ